MTTFLKGDYNNTNEFQQCAITFPNLLYSQKSGRTTKISETIKQFQNSKISVSNWMVEKLKFLTKLSFYSVPNDTQEVEGKVAEFSIFSTSDFQSGCESFERDNGYWYSYLFIQSNYITACRHTFFFKLPDFSKFTF